MTAPTAAPSEPGTPSDLSGLSTEVRDLAAALSTAAQVEPELIRAIRIGVLPHLSVDVESDLWFSKLAVTRGPHAIVLGPQAVTALHAELLKRLEDRSPGNPYRQIPEIMARVHANIDPALRLEEEIIWLGLTEPDNPAEAARRLEPILSAATGTNQQVVANWFAVAWDRLPNTVKATKVAWQLAQVATAALPLAALTPGPAPDRLALSDAAAIADRLRVVRCGVRRDGADLVLGEPDANMAISMPDTDPRVLEVTASNGLRWQVTVPAGHVVRVQVGTGALTLKNALGAVFDLAATPPPSSLPWEARHVAGAFRLEAREVTGQDQWQWLLTGRDGEVMADHMVRLDPGSWQYEAFADLLGYLSWHVAPDRRAEDEARIIEELGEWIADEVLGPVGSSLAAAAPAAVQVVLPREAAWLASRPLQLARVNGKPLTSSDVTLVIDPGTANGRRQEPVGERLRVLGVFSLPEGGQPLNLRRERVSLVQLIEGVAAGGRAADVRVLQYGATRERLRDLLEEAEGWDIIHLAGHGTPGEVQLETATGTPDMVSAAELVELLGLARQRVKLVTVSACWSAALSAAEQRRLLSLPSAEYARAASRPIEYFADVLSVTAGQGGLPLSTTAGPVALPRSTEDTSGTLATELSARLDCAVLAMRYPVSDDFAIALSDRLYGLLADKGQPLPRALSLTLRELAAETGYPPLSVGTPALFGGRALDLRLAAPRGAPLAFGPEQTKLAGFPPPPDRFIGRTGVMARASAALAERSGVVGVLLYGVPGAGKTACALELAYSHEHAFQALIWYKAPDEGSDIADALTRFVLALERGLPGLQMVHLLEDSEKLRGFLPTFTEFMSRTRLLIVIDNAESLLADNGQWRDPRWSLVIGALTNHRGLGRLILTSRRVPAGLPGLLTETVDVLPADEALLLARELPHLRRLISGELPGIDPETSRQLAIRTLNAAHGLPKLLELADGQAARPERLAALVATGDQAWSDTAGPPDGLFATGSAAGRETTADSGDYWHVMAAWTYAVADTLPPGLRDLFWFLCCLEEIDRERWILDGNWADLWRRLGRDGQPPALDEALALLASAGLIDIRSVVDTGHPDYTGYVIHPAVADAGRNRAGLPFRDAADTEAAAFWTVGYRQGSGLAGEGSVHTELAVRAGLGAVPYLIRQQRWADAAALLEGVFVRYPSRAYAAAMLPAIQEVTRHDPHQAATLALLQQVLDPGAAEAVMRDALQSAVDAGDYRAMSGITGRLVDLCREGGRLAEALDLAERKPGYTRRADLGPWTELADRVQRLQVLNAMGLADDVLSEVQRLREIAASLPGMPQPDEMVTPWNIGEVLLATGRDATIRLGRWADALDFSAAIVASLRDRSAPSTRVAQAIFNDYGPLLGLGRSGDAVYLLRDCLQAFQDAQDTAMFGKALDALATTDDRRGRGEAALRLEPEALRYMYLAGSVLDIAVGYHNLGTYLARHTRRTDSAFASYITAALIRRLIGTGGDNPGDDRGPLLAAAGLLREPGAVAARPSAVADLARQLGDIPGTDLPRLIASLSSGPPADEMVSQTVTAARQLAETIRGENETSPELVIAVERIAADIKGPTAIAAARIGSESEYLRKAETGPFNIADTR
jgi:hypothetical protein